RAQAGMERGSPVRPADFPLRKAAVRPRGVVDASRDRPPADVPAAPLSRGLGARTVRPAKVAGSADRSTRAVRAAGCYSDHLRRQGRNSVGGWRLATAADGSDSKAGKDGCRPALVPLRGIFQRGWGRVDRNFVIEYKLATPPLALGVPKGC